MKKLVWVMVVGCLFVVPELAQAQVDKMIDRFLQRGRVEDPARRPEDCSNGIFSGSCSAGAAGRLSG